MDTEVFIPQLIVFDFDGVFTDNSVYVFEDGREMVRCSRADGLGLDMLQRRGVPAVILSTETNPVVAARARKLRLEAIQGCADKAFRFKELLRDRALDWERVVYVGNDLNDLAAMALAGLAVCPADAHPSVRDFCGLVLKSSGGRGAVREFCEMVCRSWDAKFGALDEYGPPGVGLTRPTP